MTFHIQHMHDAIVAGIARRHPDWREDLSFLEALRRIGASIRRDSSEP